MGNAPTIVTYVCYLSPGIGTPLETLRVVPDRNPERDKYCPPHRGYVFYYFDRLEQHAEFGGEKVVLSSPPRNVSTGHRVPIFVKS